MPARIDPSTLDTLSAQETAGASWAYGWPNNPNPPVAWLSPTDLAPTTIPPDQLITRVTDALSAPTPTAPRGPTTYS